MGALLELTASIPGTTKAMHIQRMGVPTGVFPQVFPLGEIPSRLSHQEGSGRWAGEQERVESPRKTIPPFVQKGTAVLQTPSEHPGPRTRMAAKSLKEISTNVSALLLLCICSLLTQQISSDAHSVF